VQIVHDHVGQPLVMDEQALADRVGVLPCDRNRPHQDLLRPDPSIDLPFDKADPVFDDLRLFLQIGLAAGSPWPGRIVSTSSAAIRSERGQPFPGVAFLHPGPAFVEHVVAGEDDALLGAHGSRSAARCGPACGLMLKVWSPTWRVS